MHKDKTAVALKYDKNAERLPVIAASGYGYLAEAIINMAKSHGLEVREDSDLTEILAALDIGSEIPTEAIMAVAQILNYVYRVNKTA